MNKKELQVLNKEGIKLNLLETNYTPKKSLKKLILLNQPKLIVKNNTYVINQPAIFKKNKSSIKTIRYNQNDAGSVRHFTPAAQEWFNNIYSYNDNYIKLLPVADKNLMYLLKSYFNFFVSPKNIKIKRIANRYRKLSANKVFVGKGELKHTNEKVIITSYIYNVKQLHLKSKIFKEARVLFYPSKDLEKDLKVINGKTIIKYNRRFTLEEFLKYPGHPLWHKIICFKLFWKKYIKLIGQKLLRDEEKKIKKLKGENKKNYVKYIDQTKEIFSKTFALDIGVETMFKNFFEPLLQQLSEKKIENEKKFSKFKFYVSELKILYDNFDLYMAKVKLMYEKNLRTFFYLLMINNVKFEKPFIIKLTELVKKIYNKKIEFNIVNLYKMHLNSDIYTQAVSLKLRNRDNKLFRVLTRSLTKINLPNVSRIGEKYHKENKDEFLANKIRNNYINSMLDSNKHIDSLNSLLISFFPLADNISIEIKKRSSVIKQPISLYRYILKTLKHIKLAGIRVEAKGRLTRRFTAAKSVFKVRWKGGLKNVDSSFKGLSATMLRGDRNNNVEYSVISSKNRNGAFGVKGWIGNK